MIYSSKLTYISYTGREINLFTCCGLILFRFKFKLSSFLSEVMSANQLKQKKTKFELRITLKQNIYTVEPRHNEPLYNEVFGITNNFVYPQ